MKKVVLAGGTGFIGRYMEERCKELGYTVHIISRQEPHISWENKDRMIEALDGAELLVNLAGKSVNCRYNETNKRAIMLSRTSTTKRLGEAVQTCEHPPKMWINSSTATIYRHAEDRPMTEEAGEVGSGFSVDVARGWEEAFFSFDLPKTRQVALRIAIVLGPGGGVMTPYRNLVKYGLGGPQGSGRQRFSWIHLEDLFGIIMFLNERPELNGVFNCAAPNPVQNDELMAALRRAANVGFGLPAPEWLLELGAKVIRTETELVLKSRWVLPERLERAGYTFLFPTLDKALQSILSS
ncbi:TIGR01777 family oxidoreductase [Domibacillus sp. 8LH]|uniref:TIGR01777 family oxidoreductase n=1 Tax=Domibacillus sp. 8LH TaxID=3073900 RepID=UPI0031740B1D